MTSAQSTSFSLLLLALTFVLFVGRDDDDFLEPCELFLDMLLDIISTGSRCSRFVGERPFLFKDMDIGVVKDAVVSNCCCSCSRCACKGARLSWGVWMVTMSALTLLSEMGETF